MSAPVICGMGSGGFTFSSVRPIAKLFTSWSTPTHVAGAPSSLAATECGTLAISSVPRSAPRVLACLKTRTVPIVIIACDAVTTGFVASLARPGGNLTGVSCLTSELMPKRMALFRELLPSLTRIAVLYNPENVSKPDEAARTAALAREQGLAARAIEFRTAEDIERA